MNRFIFNTISVLLHPILMPLLGVFLILYSGTYLSILPPDSKRVILIMTALFTILLPISILPFLRYYKLISQYTIPERKERLIPLFVSSVFYVFGLYLFKKHGIPVFIQKFLLASALCLIIATVIHIWWKISTHMIGIGGILGLISTFSYLFNMNISAFLTLLIFAAGLVGTSRLSLKSHSQAQVYGGFMLGYIISFTVVALFNGF